jgi:hypothetical protein
MTHPSERYFLIEGGLTKTDGAVYADDDDEVTLVNSGLMYLFNSIKQQLSDKTVESFNYPGEATTILGLFKYPRGIAKAQGLHQL